MQKFNFKKSQDIQNSYRKQQKHGKYDLDCDQKLAFLDPRLRTFHRFARASQEPRDQKRCFKNPVKNTERKSVV